MKQSNIKWIQPNLYNWEETSKLVSELKAATQLTNQPFLGWVSEQYQEDGIIREYGVVPEDDTSRTTPFMYNLADLCEAVEYQRKVVVGEHDTIAPAPGSSVVASITNEWHKRGDVGTVVEEQTAYWPHKFGVRWTRTGKISYVDQFEVLVVTGE